MLVVLALERHVLSLEQLEQFIPFDHFPVDPEECKGRPPRGAAGQVPIIAVQKPDAMPCRLPTRCRRETAGRIQRG